MQMLRVVLILSAIMISSCKSEAPIVADARLELVISGKATCDQNCPEAGTATVTVEFGEKQVKLGARQIPLQGVRFKFVTQQVVIGYNKTEVPPWAKRVVVRIDGQKCLPALRDFPLVALPDDERQRTILDLGDIELDCRNTTIGSGLAK